MPDFTFTDPGGQTHTITGPEGATREQAFNMLQLKLSSAPSHEEVNQGLGSIRQRLLANLMPSRNTSSYSPYKPADPNNMPNDAINPVGTDAQMGQAIATAGLGSIGGPRANIEIPAPPPAAPPTPPGPNPFQLPMRVTPGTPGIPAGPAPAPPGPNPFQLPMRVTPNTQGMPPIRGPGGRFMPNPGANQPAGVAPTAPQPPPAQNPFQGGPAYRPAGLAPASPQPPPAQNPFQSGPGSIPANPITEAPPLPGTTPQQATLLQQALHGAASHLGGHVGAKVLGGMGAYGIAKMLGIF